MELRSPKEKTRKRSSHEFQSAPHKLIIMGDEGVGKTSIFSVIFLNSCPENTLSFSWTNGVSESKIGYGLDNTLLIKDCGGQKQFQNEYLTSKKKEVFTNVDILVFVIEAKKKSKQSSIEEKKEKINSNIHNNNINTYNIKTNGEENNDFFYFEKCLSCLSELSPKAKVFVLIHKMDLIEPKLKDSVIQKNKNIIQKIYEKNEHFKKFQISCIPTSIWEKSLYTAWKYIMSKVEMDLTNLKKGLDLLREACSADDVAILEKSTFLILCSSSQNGKEFYEDERFDKLSALIKKLMKSSLNLGNKGCNYFHFTNKKITAYIEEFTSNTLILIILTKPKINFALFSVNIALTRKQFEMIMNQKDNNNNINTG